MSKKKQHTKQFKLDAIRYRKEHPNLTQIKYAKNLGIGSSTLARWKALRLSCFSSQKDICKGATQGIYQRANTNDLWQIQPKL